MIRLTNKQFVMLNGFSWLSTILLVANTKVRFLTTLFWVLLLKGRLGLFRLYYSQALLESANFQNVLSKEYKNPFSMGAAGKRKHWQAGQIASGVSDGLEPSYFAVYNSFFQAIWDRVLWDDSKGLKLTNTNESGYMFLVQSYGYATDANYISKWNVYWGRVQPWIKYSIIAFNVLLVASFVVTLFVKTKNLVWQIVGLAISGFAVVKTGIQLLLKK